MRIAAMIVLLYAGSCMAFADEPAPSTPAAPAAPAAAGNPATAATPATQPATTPPVDPAQAEVDAKKAAAQERIRKSGLGGYKPEVHGGVTQYCKVEQKIGSRFSEKQCRTYEQLMSDQQTGKDFTDQLQKMGVQPRQ